MKSFLLFAAILSSKFEFSHSKFQNLSIQHDFHQFSTKILSQSLNFIPNENTSSHCRISMDILRNSVENLEFWALKMLDANAKLSSGLLSGNINQYGDFDQCIGTEVPHELFRGKYCLAHIMLDIQDDFEYFKYLRHRMLALNPFVSEFRDISHILPKSSEIRWALCLPSSCSADDFQQSMTKSLTDLFGEFPVKVKVQVNETDCQMSSTGGSFSTGEMFSIFFFAALFTVIISSTVAEFALETDNEILTSFSLKRNLNELTSTATSGNEIRSMHGIRSILTLLLVLSHKAMELNFNPIAQKLQMNEFFLQPFSLIFRIAYLHTDVFLMFSGFLVMQSFLNRQQRGQSISMFSEIIGRYVRLMPSITVLIVFVTFLLPLLGGGPLWPMLVGYQSELCKKTWLRSIFMVQNLMGFEDICMMHTHHVATDFQLFLLAPAVAVMLWTNPSKTVKGLVLVAVLSTVARFTVVYFRGFTVYVTAGTSIEELIDVANHMYILPHYRFTVYFMGILLAFYIHKFKGTKLSESTVRFNWTLSVLSLLSSIGIGHLNETHSALSAAIFASICSVTYCAFFGWVILSSHFGHDNILTVMLEWKYWKVGANLSYAVYLVQFAVFHYNIGTMRGSMPFRLLGSVVDLNEMFVILLSAVALTVCVDYPFKNLKKAILDRKSSKMKEKLK